MNSEKYIGLDVHQATISVAVLDSRGKLVMESILETQAATILEFFAGLRGTLWVTFEEGTWTAWLYDLLKPHVGKLVVCNPRKNGWLKVRNKSDLSPVPTPAGFLCRFAHQRLTFNTSRCLCQARTAPSFLLCAEREHSLI